MIQVHCKHCGDPIYPTGTPDVWCDDDPANEGSDGAMLCADGRQHEPDTTGKDN